jgi:hypothetical protein
MFNSTAIHAGHDIKMCAHIACVALAEKVKQQQQLELVLSVRVHCQSGQSV